MTLREKNKELVREFAYFLRDKGLLYDEIFYVFKLAKRINFCLVHDEEEKQE